MSGSIANEHFSIRKDATSSALRLHRSFLLTTVSLSCLLGAAPVFADDGCDTSGDPWTCSFSWGEDNSSIHFEQSGQSYGADGVGMTVNNYFDQDQDIPTSSGYNQAWYLQTSGAQGQDTGTAGNGGDVRIYNDSAINYHVGNTSGLAVGMNARSLGGEGDQDNGDNDSDGGTGGNGGSLYFTNDGIAEYGVDGGSDAGFVIYLGESYGGMGGKQNDSVLSDQRGGQGGSGGAITIVNSSAGFDLGLSSSRFTGLGSGGGFIAKSIGGEGGFNNGNAGAGGAVSITGDLEGRIYWDVTVGGGTGLFGLSGLSQGGDGTTSSDNSDNGGNGGDGGTVTISNGDELVLDVLGNVGEISAVMAGKSAGGSGGTGPSEDHYGGSGGSAGTVSMSVGNDGAVTASGDYVYGILGQSIGGEGGDGGDGAALAGTGGGGGFGGNAGNVTISVDLWDDSVSTDGDYASAIVAHSVGGGGGTGGDFVSVLGGQAGNGGNGGDAGNVLVSIDAQGLTTDGDHSFGIVAQSIAGSGGTGGIDTSTLVGLGGDGAGGGSVGTVTVNSSAPITTQGFNALGIIGQSIGGGGGAAGSSTGLVSVGGNAQGNSTSDGGTVGISNTGNIATKGESSIAILAQSIGGGGGSGGDVAGIAGVGGQGAAGGDGGIVAIPNIGKINTFEDSSPGAVFQSIGGGGGNGGSTLTLSAIASIGIGGSASGGGDGGLLCIDNSAVCGANNSSGTFVPYLSSLANPDDDGDARVTTIGDFAPGVVAQSVGGGGGNGGSDKNYSALSFFALQTGGSAGAGGAGGTIRFVQNDFAVNTSGAQSPGLIAQSIGGGGGTGGSASYFDATIGFNAAFIVGGSGGAGGSGGTLNLDLTDAYIATGLVTKSTTQSAPNNSVGILAQSIGGGGGSGGAVSASDFVVAAPTGTGVPVAFNYQAAVGGNGANAGNGGSVSVSFDDDSGLTTIGDAAHGIVAQSIGGGGGNGGDASVLSTTLGDKDTVEVTAGVAFGGGAGNIMSDFNAGYSYTTSGGGAGGSVSVTLGTYGEDTNATGTGATRLSSLAPEGTMLTFGDGAHGVLAQSIGGGGGNGGVGNSNAYAQGGVASLKADISLGGQGGSGGNGNSVTVHNFAGYTVQTQGSGAKGIVAQSIGGGGGNSQGGTLYLAASTGGFTGTLNVGVGATGGSGGKGGVVYVEEYGVTETFGGDADGIVLQSIGGGGGIGGSLGSDASSHKILDLIGNTEDKISRLTDEGSSYQLTVEVGGKGGSGGDGGTVKYYQAGRVATYGDWADGVVLQSIGGGGGQGGSSVATGGDVTANIEVSVGGTGGSGGAGGDAAIWVSGESGNLIETHGYGAAGLLMQSIGGGGGQGGDGSDSQTGTMAIGGDGGGGGGAGNDGGSVYTYNDSDIFINTYGSDAAGLIAQAIGGGGGTGGVGSSVEATRADGHELSVSVGGSGGTAGDGGTINLQAATSIVTLGNRSHGVVLQSIGGGGGLGVTGSVGGDLDLSIGGMGGAAGNGNTVTYDLTGGTGIATSGIGAHGIIAQSIGGGGGLGGDATGGVINILTSGENASGGASGNGDTITLDIGAPIAVTGQDAIGVVAQSIGGGGGLGGGATGAFAGVTSSDGAGTGGDIAITITDSVSSTGTRGLGVFAQSQGPDGNDQVSITVNSGGQVIGGYSDSSSAIMVAGGSNNSVVLNDDAVVESGSYVTGNNYEDNYAVQYSGSGTTADGAILNVTVNDEASLYGDVLLENADGNTAGTVTNNSPNTLAGGYFYGAHIVNNGRFVLNRAHDTGTTVLTGNFVQSDAGKLVADIDLNNSESDLFEIRGDASLDGTLGVDAISLLPGRRTRFLTVDGALSGSLTPQESLVFDYAINTVGTDHYLSVDAADFTPLDKTQMSEDQIRLAQNLQSIWNLGGNNAFGSLFGAIANEVDNAGRNYGSTLDELRPRAALAPAVEQAFEMLAFGNSLMSCPVFETDNAFLSEGSCGWARLTAGTGHRQATGMAPSYNADAVTYTMGAQKEIAPGWFVGTAAAFQQSWISQSSNSVSGEGMGGFAGVSLKHEIGDWTLSGAVSGSYAQYDMDRRISITNVAETVSSSPNVYNGAIRARIARTFAATSFYAKPFVDLDAIYSRVGEYKESGIYGLEFDETDQWNFAVTPSLELGSRYNYDSGTSLRFFGRVGLTVLSNNDWQTRAQFVSAPSGAGKFTTTLDHEDVFASIGAGLQLTSVDGFDLRLEYDGRFSDKLATNSGSLRVSIPF
ncbi:autotransporter outer membrane beta-barrel domain-containing protein [Labrenzia sp. 011]|uniref:autotransporter outer membrane beta-barrel domain-containing protein n=1 Tax=Labrenzia sp. 011 TaxID=2171494 RepID=UPI000D50F91C|nr:autotransporter outer membrane beta-barrel domain-containing protein [Labrenzia sp. 011]PVB59351.1 autotransporter [Labrenzia sp. 011]